MANEVHEMEKVEAPMQQSPENTRPRKIYVPKADIIESNDNIVVLADMPGVDQDSVDITLEKNVLTLQGFVHSNSIPNHTLAYSEYGIGDYRRVFTLSNEIDRSGIEATVSNGVLRLTLPKSKDVLPKKIAVKAATK